MQYILTQEEYLELREAKDLDFKMKVDKLQKLCTHIADTMPVYVKWREPPLQPWGCIFSVEEEWYCDECPVKSICPNNRKEYSK